MSYAQRTCMNLASSFRLPPQLPLLPVPLEDADAVEAVSCEAVSEPLCKGVCWSLCEGVSCSRGKYSGSGPTSFSKYLTAQRPNLSL